MAFAEEVKAKTDGRIEIKVYSGSVLGDWVDGCLQWRRLEATATSRGIYTG